MKWSSSALVVVLAGCSSPSPRGAAAGAQAWAAPPAAPASPSAGEPVACGDSADVAIFTSPRTPHRGAPLRIMVVAERPSGGAVRVRGADGTEVPVSAVRRGGPPYWWSVDVDAPSAGVHRITLDDDGSAVACREVRVEPSDPPRRASSASAQWTTSRAWGRATENLYSAWIEKLFDSPDGELPSWPALHEVLRDRSRNFLHDHLGEREDRGAPDGLVIDPDCADLPYFLRAYFAWKLELPFGFAECSRGDGRSAPRCGRWFSNLDPRPAAQEGKDDVAAFGWFLRRKVADVVQSGAGRTAAGDDASDFYSVPLTAESLRPGAVFADPYGHVLVVAHRTPQTADAGGALFAVDGQPDATIAKKRFWRGNFLFAIDPALGAPGFKRFRPVVADGAGLRRLSNAEIARRPDYGDVSTEQYEHGVDGFYDRMDDMLSPEPLDPARAMRETIQALDEQVRARVVSVENGRKHVGRTPEAIEMPEGAAIFESTGRWEDFSTPSRDLRLLTAIDVVRGFPERVRRRPERFTMPQGRSPDDAKTELEAILAAEARARSFRYTRTDGSSFTLTLDDVLSRADALEMAYDPNDCPELRWGAPLRSDEASTCRRRAPDDQRAKMAAFRPWFHERKRPPRP